MRRAPPDGLMAAQKACVRRSAPVAGRRRAVGPRRLPSCRREYVCRFCSCPRQTTFFVAPLNLVDLLAILPFYLSVSLGKGQVRRPCARAAACAGSLHRALPCRAPRNRRPSPRVHVRLTLSGAETTWTSTATSSTRAQWVPMTAVGSQTSASCEWCAAQRRHSTAPTCIPG